MTHQLISKPHQMASGALISFPAMLTRDVATAERVLNFFTANIRNPNTRKAYAQAVTAFATWGEKHGLADLANVRPVHIATYIEELANELTAPSVKLKLAAIRMLFDWLVVGQIVPVNPASSVRGPKHVVKKGRPPCCPPRKPASS